MAEQSLKQAAQDWLKQHLFLGLPLLLSVLLFLSPRFGGSLQAIFLFLMWVLGLWTLLRREVHKQQPFSFPLFWPFLAFLAAGMLATAAAANTAAGFNWISREAGLMVLFILAYQWGRDPQAVLAGLKPLLIAAGLLAAYGLFQSLVGLSWTVQDLNRPPFNQQPWQDMMISLARTRRAFSLFAYPNLFGGFLATVLPLNLAMLYPGINSKKWPWLATLVLMLLGLLASGSFGAWTAALVGAGLLVVWLPLERRLKFRMVLLTSGLALVGLTFLLWRRPWHELVTSWEGRLGYWRMTMAMVKAHWLLGVGPGNFAQAFAQVAGDKAQPLRFAHQFLLQQLAEKGVLGLAAMLWILGAAGHYLLKLKMSLQGRPAAILVPALAAGLAAGLIHAGIDLDADYLKTGMVLWFLGGVLLRQAEVVGQRPVEDKGVLQAAFRPWPVISLAIVMILGLLLWKGGKSLTVQTAATMLSIGLAAVLVMMVREQRALVSRLWAKTPLKLTWAVLLLWILLTVAHAQDSWQAATALWVLACALVLMILVIHLKVLGKLLMWFLTLAPVVLAAIGLIQVLLHPGARAGSGWPNPNLAAAFMASGLIINLSYALMSRPGTLRFFRSWPATVVLFAGLVATGSMAGWLNFMAGMGLMGLWAVRQGLIGKKTVMAALLAVIALMLMLPLGTGKRFLNLPHYQTQFQERLGLVNASWKMIKAHPWLGIGPAHFNQTFDRYSFPNPTGPLRFGRQANFSHQELLQAAVVLGLPGLLILLGLLVQFGRRYYLQWHQDKNDAGQVDLMLAWAVLAGALLQAQADFNWHLPALFVLYMMLAGLVWADGEDLSLPPLRLKASALALLGVFVLFTTLLAVMRPTLGTFFTRLGEAHYYKKHLKTADYYLEQALSLTPLSAVAYDKLGVVRHDLYAISQDEKLFYPAQWAFNKALSFNPGRAATYRHLGRLYWERGGQEGKGQWFKAAVAAYHKAVELDPHNAVLYFELGNLWRDAGRLRKAKSAWLKALALQPHYAAAASNLGVACELLHEDKQAEKAYRQALSALAFKDQLENKMALEFFSMDWAVVYYNLGALLERQGRLQEARAEYKAALKLEPQNSMAQDGLERIASVRRRAASGEHQNSGAGPKQENNL